MKIPENFPEIFRRTKKKCKQLIEYGYWSRIDGTALDKWLSNFNTDEELFIAALVLNSIIYRNEPVVSMFVADILQFKLPNHLIDVDKYKVNSIEQWMTDLKDHRNRSRIPIRFTAVEGAGLGDRPGKSGSVIYRSVQRSFFHRDFGVARGSLYQRSFTNSNITTIVMFDDIAGSGQQFVDFFSVELNGPGTAFKDLPFYFVYSPICATQEAIDKIESEFNNIKVIPGEVIGTEHSLFSRHNTFLCQPDVDTLDNIKEHYEDMAKANGFRQSCMGFGGQAMSYVFYDSTPNNNAKLIYESSDKWNPLFVR
ncbi:hypothetical protein KUV89_12975 [Marinobacter hydrocarbonoclasticus]|nr:hypothetical protein [Marinobacter nauticus]